ncbi:predicted protein [Naegleria gruberi]|uniref:Predicted protein n=1 Tax=Naegleria gruberi TaxID=5762 RepID=D2VGN6_NAEGR|nr:uncharacterized protein NAEGRDRAFT_68042 [Naegleria gruberi]EFC43999.1 predicted protein [Naegleria gruberi]|eukprot:XP_002676743.1 predicted protein [Naegleria gruberi strain NEG-M]
MTGYVRGVCKKDNIEQGIFATGKGEETVTVISGSTDASLTPYHVDRGKLFVEERFSGHSLIKVSVIQKNIELTRFPVPIGEDPKDSNGYPGIVRAADLIGQLSEPRYLQKIAALYYEFAETGTAIKLGYKCPGDLRNSYPKFYWKSVYPYIKNILPFLNTTQEGKFYLAGLYANVFSVEHLEGSISPVDEAPVNVEH